MKLELKYINPYLIYGLTAETFSSDSDKQVVDIISSVDYEHSIITFLNEGNRHIYDVKPLLRPLSQLTKEITHNGETFVPIDIMYNHWLSLPEYGLEDDTPLNRMLFDAIIGIPVTSYPYYMVQMMHEWKFDLYDLINNNLAIEIK